MKMKELFTYSINTEINTKILENLNIKAWPSITLTVIGGIFEFF